MANHTPGPWTSSPQEGTPGHCFIAQVFDGEGKALARIEPILNEEEASANAAMMAASLDLLTALLHVRDTVYEHSKRGAVTTVEVVECLDTYLTEGYGALAILKAGG